MRLLVAEDEKELANALAAILKHSKYAVDVVYNGRDALDYGLTQNYDGILLDIMMPGMDGLSALQQLRAQGVKTPVLLLTAKAELDDRILGLDTGADDYLTKPFAMGELLARIRAMLRRREGFAPDILSFGDIQLNRQSYELTGPQGSLRLSGKEFQMLEMLLEAPARLIPAELFMQRVWGYDAEAEISVVWVYISSLRKKLGAVGSQVSIKAARGIGYTLEEPHD
ncbi:MAG TPA: response regulator transcription factor [Candidatus Gallacutalibacter stercoravium]|nr:response regulator transcription factor [Candidatus Gallacutalibacter stercoravium]